MEGREHRLLVEFRALPEFEVEMARKGQIFKIIIFLARSRGSRRQPARGRSLAGGTSRLEKERVGALAATEDEDLLAGLCVIEQRRQHTNRMHAAGRTVEHST